MCLLTFYPAGSLPVTDALLNGAYLNNDGHGFAIVTDDQLLVRRGMDAIDMIETFDALRREHPHGPALFHSRFTTHGATTVDNCHPFPVGGDPRTVLAHNGVLPAEVQPGKDDPRSDTRITAEEFIPAFGSLRSQRTRQRLQRWMSPANKVVILTVDRRFTQQAYILNEQSGMWDGDVWYSNDAYLPMEQLEWEPSPHGQRSDWPWWMDVSLGHCPVCEAIINTAEDTCPNCGCCLDCQQLPETCLCRIPALAGNHWWEEEH